MKKLLSKSLLMSLTSVMFIGSFSNASELTQSELTQSELTQLKQEEQEAISKLSNEVVIKTEEDYKNQYKNDILEYKKIAAEREKSIDKDILKEFEHFSSEYIKEFNLPEKKEVLDKAPKFNFESITTEQESTNGESLLKDIAESSPILDSTFNDDEVYELFIRYLETKNKKLNSSEKQKLKENIPTLRLSVANSTVLKAFKKLEFPISYLLFAHSITTNPQTITIDTKRRPRQNYRNMTYGRSVYNIIPNVRYGLINGGFTAKALEFAKAGNGFLSEDKHSHYFSSGDMYFAIRNTINVRFTRIWYNRAFFRIWDIYDFNGPLSGVTYITSTKPYGIKIEGLVENNRLY